MVITMLYQTGLGSLYLAAQNGHWTTAEVLLSAGAEVNQESSSGINPLTVAAGGDHAETVQVRVNYCRSMGGKSKTSLSH